MLVAPAYHSCPGCGAPSLGQSRRQGATIQIDQSATPQLGVAPAIVPATNEPITGHERVAPNEQDDEQPDAPIHVKLPPLQDFAAPLRFWLGLFAAIVIGEGVMLGGFLWVTTPYSFGGASPEIAAQWLDTILRAEPIVSAARLIILAVCVYYYSRFLFRGLKNLRPVSGGNSTFNPTWGVVMHFIPFANLFGVMAMIDVWNGSHFVAKRSARTNGLIGLWWGFWIGAAALSAASDGLFNNPDQFSNGVVVAIGASLAYLVAALLLRILVRRIADAHDRARVLLGRYTPT